MAGAAALAPPSVLALAIMLHISFSDFVMSWPCWRPLTAAPTPLAADAPILSRPRRSRSSSQ